MEAIVRAILKSRTLSLESVSDKYDIYGFKCLGIADKLLDIDDVNGSSVSVSYTHLTLPTKRIV